VCTFDNIVLQHLKREEKVMKKERRLLGEEFFGHPDFADIGKEKRLFGF